MLVGAVPPEGVAAAKRLEQLPLVPLELTQTELDFGTFSQLAHAAGSRVQFKEGAVSSFEVSGLEGCQAFAIADDPDFESDQGAMRAKVVCTSGRRTVGKPFTVAWTLKFH